VNVKSRNAHFFPKHRGSLTYSHLRVLNAILHLAENGAKWWREAAQRVRPQAHGLCEDARLG